MPYKINTPITDTFFLTDSYNNPVTSATGFSKLIIRKSGSTSANLTITPATSGIYWIDFIPDVADTWAIYVNHPIYNPTGFTQTYTVLNNDSDSIATDILNLGSPLQTSSYVSPDNADITTIKNALSSLATSAAVAIIPINPLLTNDNRLNNLDASISTRLATSAYTSAGSSLTLSQIENSTILAKDATILTRLATSGYTAPDNTSIAAIKTQTNLIPLDFTNILERILGLTFENHVEDNIIRDSTGRKTQSNLYCYSTSAYASTNDKINGLVATYQFQVGYDTNGNMNLFKTLRLT